MTDDDRPLYSWWHVRHYCYICGWVGWLPGIGYPRWRMPSSTGPPLGMAQSPLRQAGIR